MGDGFQMGRARCGVRARALPMGDGFLGEACLGVVARQKLGRDVASLLLARGQTIGDGGMQSLPANAQQALVGGVADQRVLELVGTRARCRAPQHQAAGDEDVERRAEFRRGIRHDLRQEAGVEVATEHGGCLRDLAGGAEPVEPAHQRGPQRRRHGVLGFPELEDRAGQLFGEQRDAFGALDDPRDHAGRQGPLRRLRQDDPLELGGAEPRECEGSDIGCRAWPEREFRSGCGNHHQRQRLTETDDPFEPFLRGRIRPMHVLEHRQERTPLRPPTQETVEQRQHRRAPRIRRQRLELLRGLMAQRGKLCQQLAVARGLPDRVGKQRDEGIEPG